MKRNTCNQLLTDRGLSLLQLHIAILYIILTTKKSVSLHLFSLYLMKMFWIVQAACYLHAVSAKMKKTTYF